MGIPGNDFDDDAYYADLEKWILKLTADEDDKQDCAVAHGADVCGYGSTVSVGFNRGPELTRVPCWVSLNKGGNAGTGVFIPQFNNPGELLLAKNDKGGVRRGRRKGDEQIVGNIKIVTRGGRGE